MKQTNLSLGENLVRKGLLQPDELKQVEAEVKRTHESFHKVLKRLHLVDEKLLISFLSLKFDMPLVEITHQVIKPAVLKTIPENMVRKFSVFPLRKVGNRLTVVMNDPFNLSLLDQLQLATGFDIQPALATESEIRSAIEQYYGARSDVSDMVRVLKNESVAAMEEKLSPRRDEAQAEEAPIIKLVNTMIAEAVREGASDVHAAPEKDKVTVRYRIDGVLHAIDQYPKELHAGVISRVKVMANLDISETRIPQDGRVRMELDGQAVDLRISVMPTVHGENLVIRLLNARSALMSLEQLGMSAERLAAFKEVIKKPYGMLLLTGPTGSGKTTTLYAALNQINSPEKHIITIEDPVEYQLPLIRQIQVNPAVHLTFANGLRSILRQDPDVIMVGEIRDKETAEIAIQAALTGHFVFSTLHTNNAASAVARLLEMNIQPFLISSTVICVIAQRLVRTICKECRTSYTATKTDLRNLTALAPPNEGNGAAELYYGKGCLACKKTGYRSRSAIFEILVPDQEIRKLILARVSSDEIEREAVRKGMHTLRQDGWDKVKAGVTTIEEVLRVTQEVV